MVELLSEMVERTFPAKWATGLFYVRGLTGISSVCEEKNSRAKFSNMYRSVRLRVKPLLVANEPVDFPGFNIHLLGGR